MPTKMRSLKSANALSSVLYSNTVRCVCLSFLRTSCFHITWHLVRFARWQGYVLSISIQAKLWHVWLCLCVDTHSQLPPWNSTPKMETLFSFESLVPTYRSAGHDLLQDHSMKPLSDFAFSEANFRSTN